MFVLPGAEITENKVNLSSICVDDSSLNLNSNLALTLGYRANGRNIVGQKPPTLLDVTCCVCLHTMLELLGVVALSLKPVKLLNQQLPTYLLVRDRRSVVPRTRITHGLLPKLSHTQVVQ